MVNIDNYKMFRNNIKAVLGKSSIAPYEFDTCIRITFDKILVQWTKESGVFLYLDENCKKDYMAKWNKGLGRLFANDLKKNNMDKYYEVLFNEYKAIVRSISEEELHDFENNTELCENIVYTDNVNFIIIKVIENELEYSSRSSISLESNDDLENDSDSNDIEDEEIDENEEIESEVTSYSLFED